MYELFVRPPRRFTGAITFPEISYLRRSIEHQVKEVKAYYRRHPKRVDADNKIANVLYHIPRRWDLDDRRYVRFVEDTAEGVARAFGFTSSLYRGRVHESGVTLGPKTDEVVLSTYRGMGGFDLQHAAKQWRDWAPYKLLYHTRTDLGMPILNNTTPGKGHGVGVLNIPMLALQYRYWLKEQSQNGEQTESVYRFIGSYPLVNILDSYVDIALFNRLSRQARGVGTQRHPTPHPFYLTDYSRRFETINHKILETQERRSGDIEQLVYTTPMMLHESLWGVMRLPTDPVNRQNEWALQLARLPYIRYIVEEGVKPHQGDRRYLNEIYTSLIEASQDNIFSGVGSATMVKTYRENIRQLIKLLHEKKQGWA